MIELMEIASDINISQAERCVKSFFDFILELAEK